jgi:CrcB protein
VIKFLLLVGIGGFIGSLFRYWISGMVQNISGSISFAFGTLAVNTIGCFIIGFFAYLIEARSMLTSEIRAFVLVGLLGAFTTFSTFGNETYNHIVESKFHLVLINIGAHVFLGLSAVYLGRLMSFMIWR